MQKIILLGQDGMLGSELKQKLEKNYEAHGTTVEVLDICSKNAVMQKARQIQPNYIINCAAYTNVDGCETNCKLAENVNGHAVANIADACNETDATLIQISTDYVFDGKLVLDKTYTEDMKPNPVNSYGRSKLIGEENAKKVDKHYILRTAWLYGQGKNFVRTMLKLAETKDKVAVVCDQHGSPTSTTTLCDIIEQIIIKQPKYGIYHTTNEGFTTWYEFAKKIFEIAKIGMIVEPVTSEQYSTPVKRPTNSKLSKEKLHNIGIYTKSYEEALKEYLKKELQEKSI